MLSSAWLLVLGATACACALVRRELTEEDGPHAVCNDGSRAVYYHSAHAPGDPRRFVIHLQGGFFCASARDCVFRCTVLFPMLCTAMTNDSIERGAILSDSETINPGLASAFKVFLPYCTSDMHIGDRHASLETADYHFRGRRVFNAVINSLKRYARLDEATEVVLSGSSAGGRGVAFNCHHLQSMLPQAQVKCVVDAAIFYPVTKPFYEACPDFNDVVTKANAFWHGDVPAFDVETWWKHFDLPLFISSQMFDPFGMYFFCVRPDLDAHVQAWGAGMADTARALARERPDVGLYAPPCFKHGMVMMEPWFSKIPVGPDQLTLTHAIANWLRQTPPYQAWEECETRDGCSTTCFTNKTTFHDEL